MIRVTKAEVERAGLSARVAYPPPTPKVKARKRLRRTSLRRRRKTIRTHSAKAPRRIAEWSPLRDSILARDGGVCQFCDGTHERMTAHHVIPRANGGEDSETNLVTIGITFRGFGGCHAAAHHDIASSKRILLRRLARRYGVLVRECEDGSAQWDLVNEFGMPLHYPPPSSGHAASEVHALERGLAAAAEQIRRGRKRSMLDRSPEGRCGSGILRTGSE